MSSRLLSSGVWGAQKSLDGGIEYCKRKVNLIAENMNEIGKVWLPGSTLSPELDRAQRCAPPGNRRDAGALNPGLAVS